MTDTEKALRDALTAIGEALARPAELPTMEARREWLDVLSARRIFVDATIEAIQSTDDAELIRAHTRYLRDQTSKTS